MMPLPPRSTLFPYTTLFRSVELAVVHLADPVLRIDEVGADPVHPHVGRGLGLGRGRGQVRPDVADHLRSEEHTSELQSQSNIVCRLLLEKKKTRFRMLELRI